MNFKTETKVIFSFQPTLRCIGGLLAFPCLLVLFGNEWWTLLSVEGVPGEWLEVEVPEEGFVLGINITH